MIIVKYQNEEEMQQIIDEKQAAGYTLIEVQNITEGNFLGFEEPGWIPTETPPDVTNQIKELQNENTDLKLAIAELAETNESDKIDMQLALAELAELVAGGDQVG
ncbi:hypothetical protein AWM70_03280 [Paenibacillus yonginensis]|uniref:Uncharacterized protein n=1 Tax=Paenibacillus yonginensis TaxID=1462996 RepID=A0A1B1MX21_9BACL|nr:hypothetical protein [Paenibacillus yonginensis]ANS73716.1 hypothetical protein AWM70_03280 [Paenibacillus yonginensis]